MTDELATLREENVRLRSKLLEIAKECSHCDGAGIVTTMATRRGQPYEFQEACLDCADIRAVLE